MILAGYVGSLLMAGAFLAIGAAVSALTKNQVIAFVLAVALCFLFAAAGSPVVTELPHQRLPVLAEIARALRSPTASPASPAAWSRRGTSSFSPPSSASSCS